MVEDQIAAGIIIGLIVFVVSLIVLSIWCMCKAASDADNNITEEWNKNWTGQKFNKK